MSDFLDLVAEKTKARVAAAQKERPLSSLQAEPQFSRSARDVLSAFQSGRANIIAEIKFASPSEGRIHDPVDPVDIASGYLRHGARMISVLTEPDYFMGSLSFLENIREAFPDALLLRKDFILDSYQLYEAKAFGADAILLIVAMLEKGLFRDLLEESLSLGLTPLVEVHNEAELEVALEAKARMIGVNNRNLKSLKVDLETSRRLIGMKPEDAAFICESGIKSPEVVREMMRVGYNGFLVGTCFMKNEYPVEAFAAFQKELS
jgi:indole-3-glycerol phosphate synthase